MKHLSLPLATITYIIVVRMVPDLFFIAGLGLAVFIDWLMSPVWEKHEHHEHAQETVQESVHGEPDQRLVS